MKIGLLKEGPGESRVAITPEIAGSLLKLGVEAVWIEKEAGHRAFFPDNEFVEKGGMIKDRASILKDCQLIITINSLSQEEWKSIQSEQVVLGQFNPLGNRELVEQMQADKHSVFSMELIPRTTRAQAMDTLSSMATAAGYKAVLRAASYLPTFFPMFMTAAGTIKPAKVLVIGAGVAGLQAIATARRLGAMVEAFDVRAAAKEEVLSLGAKFVDVEGATDDTSAGGYAVEQTEDFKKRQAEAVHQHAIQSDVIICTAQIPGRRAPLIIHKATVEQMKPGAVIVDLAASTGGNCEVTKNDEVSHHGQVCVIGDSNLAASIPKDSSSMFGKNVLNFLKLMIKEGELVLDFEDDIVQGTCLTHQGELYNERVKKLFAVAND
jgi:NAD(P) transhydrogenase subunit alpha